MLNTSSLMRVYSGSKLIVSHVINVRVCVLEGQLEDPLASVRGVRHAARRAGEDNGALPGTLLAVYCMYNVHVHRIMFSGRCEYDVQLQVLVSRALRYGLAIGASTLRLTDPHGRVRGAPRGAAGQPAAAAAAAAVEPQQRAERSRRAGQLAAAAQVAPDPVRASLVLTHPHQRYY